MKKLTVSKKKRNRIIMIAALVLLVLAACYTIFIAPLLKKEEWIYKEASVERGTLTVGVVESGALEYGITSVLYELDLSVNEEEEEDEEEATEKYLEIEEIYAKAGQRIVEGDKLIKFTEESVAAVRRLLENAVVEAKADYNEAETEYNLAVLEAETDYNADLISKNYAADIYRSAKTSIGNEILALKQEIEHRTAQTASLEEELAEAQEDYREALAEYTEAAEYYAQLEADTSDNFLYFQNLYLTRMTTYQNAKSTLKQAEQSLEDNAAQIQALQTELKAAAARQNVDTLSVEESYQEAVINGENAEVTYNAQLESLKEELSEAEETKKELEEKLNAFQKFVGEEGIIRAEKGGIVTESRYGAGDTLKQTGVLIAYAEPENMTIPVDVAQEDVVDLTVGDKVEIEFTAYEGLVYQGSILSIDTTATSTESDTVSYTVVIGVEGNTEALYGGMVADITFVKEQKEGILFVSRKAIVEKNNKTYVYRDGVLGGRELVQVETGISNGSSVEILSGLQEGDVIYIASRVSSEEEVKSSNGTFGKDESTGDNVEAFQEFDFGEMEPPMGMDFGDMQMPGGGRGDFSGAPGGFGGRGENR